LGYLISRQRDGYDRSPAGNGKSRASVAARCGDLSHRLRSLAWSNLGPETASIGAEAAIQLPIFPRKCSNLSPERART
jgi:hypothetical protein